MNKIQKYKPKVAIMEVVTILLIFASQIKAQYDSEKIPTANNMEEPIKTAWLSVEYGSHTRNYDDLHSQSGYYEKASLEIPFGSRIGLLVQGDRWKDGHNRGSVGLGINWTFLRCGQVDASFASSLFVGDVNGYILSQGVGYRFPGNIFRIQGCVSYLAGGEGGAGGGRSLSMLNAMIGIGIGLDNLLHRLHQH